MGACVTKQHYVMRELYVTRERDIMRQHVMREYCFMSGQYVMKEHSCESVTLQESVMFWHIYRWIHCDVSVSLNKFSFLRFSCLLMDKQVEKKHVSHTLLFFVSLCLSAVILSTAIPFLHAVLFALFQVK